MTDTTNFLPNQIGITNDCLYNLKNSAVSSRSYRCSLAPTNKSSFVPNDTAIFMIPARSNCFLDTTQSYIRTTIKNNNSASIDVDVRPAQDKITFPFFITEVEHNFANKPTV